jgi:hypothetical protein
LAKLPLRREKHPEIVHRGLEYFGGERKLVLESYHRKRKMSQVITKAPAHPCL